MRNIKNNLHHKGTAELRSERLLMRKVRKQDAGDIYSKLASDEKIIEFLSWNKNPSPEYTENMVAEIIAEYEEKKSSYKWVIESLDTGMLIGMILVDSSSEERLTAEIDYCIAEEYRGMGYAPEALRRVIEYLIYDVGFFRIEAVHNMTNEASGRVMQKAGMQFEGILRGRAINLNKDGNPDDMKMYAVIKTDLQ